MSVDELLKVRYKSIPNFPDYRVGDDGSVWSKSRNTRHASESDAGWHRINGGKDKDGYRKVILCNKGKRRYARVHILVVQSFIGNAPKTMGNPTVAHGNGVKGDNRLVNLRWASQKENIADKIKHGTHQIGESHPSSIVSESDVAKIRERRKNGETLVAIAADFGVKFGAIQAICARRNWKHIA